MYSDERNWCSHQLGFPIRKSSDHDLLAASRSLSQLTTSFIAYLRQGIHTHALSSLTIKSTSHTTPPIRAGRLQTTPAFRVVNATFALRDTGKNRRRHNNLCFVMPVKYSVVKDLDCVSNQLSGQAQQSADLLQWWAWVDLNHRPHPYQGCALAT